MCESEGIRRPYGARVDLRDGEVVEWRCVVCGEWTPPCQPWVCTVCVFQHGSRPLGRSGAVVSFEEIEAMNELPRPAAKLVRLRRRLRASGGAWTRAVSRKLLDGGLSYRTR